MATRKYYLFGLAVLQVLMVSKGFCGELITSGASSTQPRSTNIATLEAKILHTKKIISESIQGKVIWEDRNIAEPYSSRPIDVATFDDIMYVYPNPASCKYDKDKDVIKQLATLLIYYDTSQIRDPDNYIKTHAIDELKQSNALAALLDLLSNRRLYMKDLIGELISYHEKIISTTSWITLFNNSTNVRYDNGAWFHNKGFPDNEDSCRKLRYPAWGNGREVIVDPEGWLYSFWLRRYKAGTGEITITLLRMLSKTLDG